MGLNIESSTYYSYHEPKEGATARLLIGSDLEGAVFRGISNGWLVEANNLLIPHVPEEQARMIEAGDQETLYEYLEETDSNGAYVAKRRVYIAQRVANIMKLRLHLPDDKKINEYIPGMNGVVAIRPVSDSRVYN